MAKKLVLLTTILLLSASLAFAGGQEEEGGGGAQAAEPEEMEQVYYEGWLSGCGSDATLNTTCTHRLDYYVNHPLAAITWQGGVQPLLAEDWEMQEDGKVFIFNLREDVEWHDGEDFTAEDVVFSYNAYANPKVGSRWAIKASTIMGYQAFQNGDADSLEGVTAIDENTVRVELSREMPLWPKLEQTYLVVFPEHLLGDTAPEQLIQDPYWRNRVGTGPFKWEEYKADQYISLVPNEDYFMGAPELDRIVLRLYADASTHVAALEAGEIHTTAYETTLISVNDVERLESKQDIDVVIMEKGSPTFLRMNHDREWGDVRIRKAIRYGIDIESILEAIYPGARPAITMFPQDWAVPDEGLNQYEYDPERARELLDEAGWSGRDVDFVYHYGDQLNQSLIVALQQNLADIGINIKPRKMDPAGLHALQNSDDFDMGYFASGMGLDPATGENVVATGSVLSQGYSNPTVDELFQEGKSLSERADRQPIYQEISEILNDELPSIWLWYDIRPLGFNTNVKGPKSHWEEQGIIYFNMPVYNEIHNWRIQE